MWYRLLSRVHPVFLALAFAIDLSFVRGLYAGHPLAAILLFLLLPAWFFFVLLA